MLARLTPASNHRRSADKDMKQPDSQGTRAASDCIRIHL